MCFSFPPYVCNEQYVAFTASLAHTISAAFHLYHFGVCRLEQCQQTGSFLHWNMNMTSAVFSFLSSLVQLGAALYSQDNNTRALWGRPKPKLFCLAVLARVHHLKESLKCNKDFLLERNSGICLPEGDEGILHKDAIPFNFLLPELQR